MGTAIRLTVDGLPELAKALEGVPLHIRQTIERPALEEAGQMIRDAIRARAPVRPGSGRLQKGIEMRTTQIEGKTAVVVRPGKKIRHAHLVEWGTAPHGRHPGTGATNFFASGVEASLPAAQELLERRISDGIAKYWEAQGGAA